MIFKRPSAVAGDGVLDVPLCVAPKNTIIVGEGLSALLEINNKTKILKHVVSTKKAPDISGAFSH